MYRCSSHYSLSPCLNGARWMTTLISSKTSTIRSRTVTHILPSVATSNHGPCLTRSSFPRRQSDLRSIRLPGVRRCASQNIDSDRETMALYHKILNDECLAAMRGERVPDQEQIGKMLHASFRQQMKGKGPESHNEVLKSCEEDAHIMFKKQRAAFVHGIRNHEGFALSPEVEAVASDDPLFARARNARLIMSNIIPDMLTENVKPYCIWHPDTATEETYRELARRYPDMKYHVGRACAVAGYNRLYQELDLLPDVSIAEEARDNQTSGKFIFDSITRQSVRYNVMDDYTRTVRLTDPPAGAVLNGDTAVRSCLAHREEYKIWPFGREFDHYFDISEDVNLGEERRNGTVYGKMPQEHVELLYSPLPRDLPTVCKDVLINMAAYEGNIDRYSRLRRPRCVVNELMCVARGIYHHTTFARWIEPRLDELYVGREKKMLRTFGIKQAIHARFIMNDDLSRIDADVPASDLPLMIWYPHLPGRNTLRELVWRRPDMWLQAAMTCIVADYQDVYDELKPPASWYLRCLAMQSPNPYYLQDQELRAADTTDESDRKAETEHLWPRNVYGGIIRLDKEPSSEGLVNAMANHPYSLAGRDVPSTIASQSYAGIYGGGFQANAALWQTFISATDEARKNPGPLYSSEEDFERRRTTESEYAEFLKLCDQARASSG